jgi:hypothetical protein
MMQILKRTKQSANVITVPLFLLYFIPDEVIWHIRHCHTLINCVGIYRLSFEQPSCKYEHYSNFPFMDAIRKCPSSVQVYNNEFVGMAHYLECKTSTGHALLQIRTEKQHRHSSVCEVDIRYEHGIPVTLKSPSKSTMYSL